MFTGGDCCKGISFGWIRAIHFTNGIVFVFLLAVHGQKKYLAPAYAGNTMAMILWLSVIVYWILRIYYPAQEVAFEKKALCFPVGNRFPESDGSRDKKQYYDELPPDEDGIIVLKEQKNNVVQHFERSCGYGTFVVRSFGVRFKWTDKNIFLQSTLLWAKRC